LGRRLLGLDLNIPARIAAATVLPYGQFHDVARLIDFR